MVRNDGAEVQRGGALDKISFEAIRMKNGIYSLEND